MSALAQALRALGLILVVGSLIVWVALGANTGWTKTYVSVARTDEVTGIEFVEKANKFVPGVDLLIPLCGTGLVCLTGSFFLRKKRD